VSYTFVHEYKRVNKCRIMKKIENQNKYVRILKISAEKSFYYHTVICNRGVVRKLRHAKD